MSEIGFGSCRGDGSIRSSDEREQHHEAKEEEDEEQVDTQGADQDDEADHGPIRNISANSITSGELNNEHCNVVESLRRVVHGTSRTAFSAERRCDLMHGILVVCQ